MAHKQESSQNEKNSLGMKPSPREHKSSAVKPSKTVIFLARLGIAWERFWPLAVPLFIISTLFCVLSWLGLWIGLPDWARIGGVIIFAIAAIAALYPIRQFKIPRHDEVLGRIEHASKLSHRPVTAQIDKPAGTDDNFAKILWQEHQNRMASQLENLSSGTARPDGNRFDRFALRAILPIIAFAALGYSYGSHGGRVMDAFIPHIDRSAILSRLDVWITPPSYTANPPLYLNRNGVVSNDHSSTIDTAPEKAINTIEGSIITIRHVHANQAKTELKALLRTSDNSYLLDDEAKNGERATQFEAELKQNAVLEVFVRDQLLASWDIHIQTDRFPEITLDELPKSARSGALELNYSMSDDFGVVSAKAMISKKGNSGAANARPLVKAPEFQLPLPRARTKKGSAKANKDLSSHPWAGSQVELVLEAVDDLNQVTRTKPVTIQLPGRSFKDPFARAIIEQRRMLALNANNAPLIADLLDAITTRPETFDIAYGPYMALRSAYRMVVDNKNDDRLRDALDVMWQTAMALEFGDLSETERRLREAQEKLSEALENGATEEEIEKLMEELRQAMNDFLEQMARELQKNPLQNNPLSNSDNNQTLTERDIERMMQRIEDLAKSGSKDSARQLLSELQRMMDNLMSGRHQQHRQAEGNQLNQSLDKLSRLMQRQQELMDETFQMERRSQQNTPQSNQRGQQNGQDQKRQNGSSQDSPSSKELEQALRQLKERQDQLRQELDKLSEQFEDLGLDPSKPFGQADKEMGEAIENLGKGKAGSAAGDQAQALDALRQGAQQLMQQMAGDQNQGGQQSGQAGSAGRNGSKDPLGRQSGDKGQNSSANTKVPDEIDAQRAREIMKAIRERLSNPLRPLIERDYLERLLQSR